MLKNWSWMDFRKGFKSTNKTKAETVGWYWISQLGGIGWYWVSQLDGIGWYWTTGWYWISQLLQTVEETVSQAKYSTFGRQRESLVYKALSKIHPVNHKSSAYVASWLQCIIATRTFPCGQRDLVQMEITKVILHLEVSLSGTLYIQGASTSISNYFLGSQ